MIQAQFQPEFESWRLEARRLISAGHHPGEIDWQGAENFNFFSEGEKNFNDKKAKTITVSKEFLEMAEFVSCARADDRWSLLYRLLYRLNFEDRNLLKIFVDKDVHRANLLMKSVRRDIHKMHAFVRFKKLDLDLSDGLEVYGAWHKPEHLTLKLGAPFFVRRFGDKPWIIYTPDLSARWDGKKLEFGAGIEQHQFETKDQFDEIWKTYYSSIFNPARIKIKAMKAELPTKYWQSLPEAALISELVRAAPERLQKMAKNHARSAIVPKVANVDELKQAALGCSACPLAARANHLVFGKGLAPSELMIVGEQPGDEEDLKGEAFVGPAGKVLQECLQLAGLQRDQLYLTNAVKHFKWIEHEASGAKMRLHQKPTGGEMHACKPWLEKEIEFVKPKLIVALGATAATAILGRLPKITDERGRFIELSAPYKVMISWHPSAILRARDAQDAEKKKRDLIQDLAMAHGELLRGSKKYSPLG